MNMVTIYTLSCPVTHEVRYVGMTTKTLEKRAYYHVHTPASTRMAYWLYSIQYAPVIEEIEVCTNELAIETEKYWIEQFKAWGFDLLNGQFKKVLECPYTEETLREIHEYEEMQKELVNHFF